MHKHMCAHICRVYAISLHKLPTGIVANRWTKTQGEIGGDEQFQWEHVAVISVVRYNMICRYTHVCFYLPIICTLSSREYIIWSYDYIFWQSPQGQPIKRSDISQQHSLWGSIDKERQVTERQL